MASIGIKRSLHHQPLVYLASAAAGGIAADMTGLVPLTAWLVALGVAATLWITTSRSRSTHDAADLSSAWRGLEWLLLIVLIVFGLRHAIDQAAFMTAGLRDRLSAVPQPAVIGGVVDRMPTVVRDPLAVQRLQNDRSPWQTRFEITADRFRGPHTWHRTDGRLAVVVQGRIDTIASGDRVTLHGTVTDAPGVSNPGQRDLGAVYRQQGLHGSMRIDDPAGIVRGPPDDRVVDRLWRHPLRVLKWIHDSGTDTLTRVTDSQTGPLAMALVLGRRDQVDPATRDALLVTGTAHLLSVSGLHLAIVVAMVQWLATLASVGDRLRLLLLIVCTILYVALTGGRPPVLRAAILVAAFVLSMMTMRPTRPMNSLGLAALLLMFWNPTLIGNVGVQLSFLAVATLLVVGGRMRPRGAMAGIGVVDHDQALRRLIDQSRSAGIAWLILRWRQLRELLIYSAAVTVVSGPLVWHHFHVLSPISVLVNVALSPLMLVALAGGLSAVVLGWIDPLLGIVPGVVCHVSLRIMRAIIATAADVPGGHVWLPSPPMAMVVIFYAALLIALATPLMGSRDRSASQPRFGRRGLTHRHRAALSVAAVIALVATWGVAAYGLATRVVDLPGGTIEAVFVDVGHGTSVVLRDGDDPSGVWLYDCGHLGNSDDDSSEIDGVLWSMGVTRLAGVILSHADADHFNAVPGLLRRFAVDRIVTPSGLMDEPEPALTLVRQAVGRYQVPVAEVGTGDAIDPDGRWRVLHPPSVRVPGSDNANSLVLSICPRADRSRGQPGDRRTDGDGITLVLPGDLEPPGTQTLVDGPRVSPGGVLMAPHHGSLRAMSELVLHWARPSQVVISGGLRAQQPEVLQTLSAVGAETHVTHRDGAIRVRIGQGPIEVRRYLEQPW